MIWFIKFSLVGTKLYQSSLLFINSSFMELIQFRSYSNGLTTNSIITSGRLMCYIGYQHSAMKLLSNWGDNKSWTFNGVEAISGSTALVTHMFHNSYLPFFIMEIDCLWMFCSHMFLHHNGVNFNYGVGWMLLGRYCHSIANLWPAQSLFLHCRETVIWLVVYLCHLWLLDSTRFVQYSV